MKILIIVGSIIVFFILLYLVQPVRKKRFLKNLLRQVRYLIPRYFT